MQEMITVSILSDQEIKKYIKTNNLKIQPLKKENIQPASIDLRLGDELLRFKPGIIVDTKKKDLNMEKIKLSEKGYTIYPGNFFLGSTLEYIELPNDIVGRVEGRSSFGRLGLTIHVTAGYVDPGFSGRITLEISNIGDVPIVIYPNQRICQLILDKMDSPCEIGYGDKMDSKYQGQISPTPSKIFNDFENEVVS